MTTAAQAYTSRRVLVDNKLALLTKQLNELDTEAEEHPADWSYAGSMAKVADQLQELLDFLK